MAFHTKTYDVYLVLTGASAALPWATDVWLPVADALAPFMVTARGKAAVRSVQIDKATKKSAKFGRLVWHADSHRKWTHDAPDAAARVFLGTEAWAPSWTQCEKDREAPDCYVSLSSAESVMRDRPLQFGGKLLVALTADAPPAQRDALRAAIADIARDVQSPLTVYQHRAWGKASFGGFTAAMNDLSFAGLFKDGDPHTCPLDPATFMETWSPVVS